jgi:hypothetical protein
MDWTNDNICAHSDPGCGYLSGAAWDDCAVGGVVSGGVAGD